MDNRRYNWLPFEDARKVIIKDAKKYSITGCKTWRCNYVNMGRIPNNIPKVPDITYKNKGWFSWGHWLGTNNKVGRVKKYHVNENFFKTWSPNMAYVLGFWFADGCIRDKKTRHGNYGFIISQHSRDKYILNYILRCMGSNNPVYSGKVRTDESGFEIISKTIFEDIINLGGSSRKSLNTKFPYVPKKYLADFIRGIFDGDGCIGFSNKNKRYETFCNISSATKGFLENMQKVIIDVYGIKCNIFHSGTCYRLVFGIEDTIKLFTVMYYRGHNTNLRLKRKFNNFKKIIKYRKEKYGSNYNIQYGGEGRICNLVG